jgi:hypothetical protein
VSKQAYTITNLVYGATYSKLFCQNHVKSLLDPSNLDAITDKYDVEYIIYTDNETLRDISAHPALEALSKKIKVRAERFAWPAGTRNRFAHRYGLLLDIFKRSVEEALKRDALLTAWVADLVVAQDFFPRILKRIEEGHGAVFVLPLRAASEAASPVLNQFHGAMPGDKLCELGLETMHPLWVACHWNTPQFTKLPFTLLWQGQGGVLARTFSTTPIVFRPKPEMINTRGMIDGDIPALCDNPYWCTDWTDAPVIGVEPVIVYYPPFANRPASVQLVKDFTKAIDPTQIPYLERQCFYPSRAAVTMREDVIEESDRVVGEILA